jgi:hypothetical protein
MNTKCHKVWFRHLKVDGGYRDTQTAGDLISLLLFFQNKEGRLKSIILINERDSMLGYNTGLWFCTGVKLGL